MLSALLIREAGARGFVLNMSSGAARFKRCRGGMPFIGYTTVYDNRDSPVNPVQIEVASPAESAAECAASRDWVSGAQWNAVF